MTVTVSIARRFLAHLLLVFLLAPLIAAASDERAQCASKADDSERLKCYDSEHSGRTQIHSAAQADLVASPVRRSYLTRSWDLDNNDEKLLGEHQSPLKPHRVSYLIVRQTGKPNQQPYSPSYGSITLPAEMQHTELKFQYSQKARVLNSVKMDFLGITSFRLWGAYTQQSNWQAFNSGNSSPFRETNYEPELIATLGTGNEYGLKFINLGYVHQSNGRNSGLSRSWNRSYMQGGWENDTLAALVRGWWRIPETSDKDDNPDIADYVGRAEITVRWAPLDGSQLIGLTLRNNLRLDQNRSFIQLDWATPVTVSQSTKLHIQFTSGYGESLIDYNFQQTTLGLGVSFRDW